MKISLVGGGPNCSRRTDRRTDGQTDMTKLIVDFRNFVNTPKYSSRSNHVIVWLRTNVSVSDSASIVRVLAVIRWHRPMSHRHFRLCSLVLP